MLDAMLRILCSYGLANQCDGAAILAKVAHFIDSSVVSPIGQRGAGAFSPIGQRVVRK